MSTITTREGLIARFLEIEGLYSAFYSAVFPELRLDRLTFTPKTDAELTAFAEAMVQEKRLEGERLTAEKEGVTASYLEKERALQVTLEELVVSTGKNGEKQREELQTEAERRGMQKSAWYLSRYSALGTEADAKITAYIEEYSGKLTDLNAEKRRKEGEYDAKIALSQAAYECAVAEQKRLLEKQQAEEERAVAEFNNDQAHKEVTYNLSAQQYIFERVNEDTVTRTSMMYDKLSACYDYLGNFSAKESLQKVNTDDIYEKYLGAYGYRSLKEHYEELAAAESAS